MLGLLLHIKMKLIQLNKKCAGFEAYSEHHHNQQTVFLVNRFSNADKFAVTYPQANKGGTFTLPSGVLDMIGLGVISHARLGSKSPSLCKGRQCAVLDPFL